MNFVQLGRAYLLTFTLIYESNVVLEFQSMIEEWPNIYNNKDKIDG